MLPSLIAQIRRLRAAADDELVLGDRVALVVVDQEQRGHRAGRARTGHVHRAGAGHRSGGRLAHRAGLPLSHLAHAGPVTHRAVAAMAHRAVARAVAGRAVRRAHLAIGAGRGVARRLGLGRPPHRPAHRRRRGISAPRDVRRRDLRLSRGRGAVAGRRALPGRPMRRRSGHRVRAGRRHRVSLPAPHRRVRRDRPRRRHRRLVVLRARVIAHGLVDEVVDGAIEVVGHLLERLPEDVPAVEVAHRLLALVHLSLGHAQQSLGAAGLSLAFGSLR